MPIKNKLYDQRSLHYPKRELIAKKLQWFSWESILSADSELEAEITSKVSVYVANLQKNVGKTFWMIKRTNEHVGNILNSIANEKPPTDLFGMVFRTDEIKLERQREINSSDLYKWFIRGSKILSKGTLVETTPEGKEIYKNRGIVVGTTISFNTMGNASGSQYENHKNCYYDEYRSKTPLPAARRKSEYSQWVTFLSNFQRGKSDVKFWLFGNNEPGADHLMEGLKIDKSTDYMIDTETGVFYFNVPEAFSGLEVEKNIATKWAQHSGDMGQFLKSNVSLESNKGHTQPAYFKEAALWGFILYKGQFFRVKVDTKKNWWLIETIEENAWQKDKTIAMTLGITTEDICFSPYIQVASITFIKFLMTQYRFNSLKFWQIGARDSFIRIWVDGVSSNFYRNEIENNLK